MLLIVEDARQKPKPSDVSLHNFDEVLDLKTFSKNIVTNVKKDTEGKNVYWLNLKWFEYRKGSETVWFKYDTMMIFGQSILNPSIEVNDLQD